MENFEELIPSKDVRGCMEKAGRKLTDFEKAAIFYNRSFPFEKTKKGLQSLMETTDDEKLQVQLAERIAYDDECLRLFMHESAGYIYILNSFEERGKPDTCGYFLDAELAVSYGKRLGYPFGVEKYTIITSDVSANSREAEGEPDESKWVGELYFSEAGELKCLSSREKEQDALYDADCDPYRFEDFYVNLPHPFERGDLVRLTTGGRIGIVAAADPLPESRFQMKLPPDYSDVKININFPAEDGGFWHEHLDPILLEKCGLPGNEQDKLFLALKEIMDRGPWAEYKEFYGVGDDAEDAKGAAEKHKS